MGEAESKKNEFINALKSLIPREIPMSALRELLRTNRTTLIHPWSEDELDEHLERMDCIYEIVAACDGAYFEKGSPFAWELETLEGAGKIYQDDRGYYYHTKPTGDESLG